MQNFRTPFRIKVTQAERKKKEDVNCQHLDPCSARKPLGPIVLNLPYSQNLPQNLVTRFPMSFGLYYSRIGTNQAQVKTLVSETTSNST